jgi:hypothetical protein
VRLRSATKADAAEVSVDMQSIISYCRDRTKIMDLEKPFVLTFTSTCINIGMH